MVCMYPQFPACSQRARGFRPGAASSQAGLLANGAGSGGGRPVSARSPATGPSRGPERPALSSVGAPGTLLLLWVFLHQPPPRVYVPAAAVIRKTVFRRKTLVCSPKAALTFST